MKNEIYINTIRQISAQQPLTDEWFDAPTHYIENYVRAIDPDFKQLLAPNTARRLGKILKRALVLAHKSMEASGISNPDAIITGTGFGCIENTELFLNKLIREGEVLLNPTQFMQSTHNTISSLVAIETKCNNYNITYAHKGISFECALQDAFLQLLSGKIQNALVGAHDEMTPDYFMLLKKSGYLGREKQVFAGETAVTMMLTSEKTGNALCKIENIDIFYNADNCGIDIKFIEKMKTQNFAEKIKNVDFVMTGVNNDPKHDKTYFDNCEKILPNVPLLQYKNIFGESYTSPALGVYAAALCLKKEQIPEFLILEQKVKNKEKKQFSKILCYNCFDRNHTFITLSKI